jgi:AraC-like DNA-binding protein
MKEYTRLWQLPHFHNLELVEACYIDFEFPRHWHDTYVIEVVEQGEDVCDCQGKTISAHAGEIIVINPHEAHTGRPLGAPPLKYRCFYPTIAMMREVSGIDSAEFVPQFPNVLSDTRLARMLLRVHLFANGKSPALQSQTLLHDALSSLVERHALGGSFRDGCFQPPLIKNVKEYLSDNFSENVTLDDLSRVSGMSPFHLLRTFRSTVGLAPHEYLISVRIERARALLMRGVDIARVACETGFCDQSHLNKHFKRILGITPGQYIKK